MKWAKKIAILLALPLCILAGYFVPQVAFGLGGAYDASTAIKFIAYTPVTPTPTPTPTPVVPTG